jgi:hypothetical protein
LSARAGRVRRNRWAHALRARGRASRASSAQCRNHAGSSARCRHPQAGEVQPLRRSRTPARPRALPRSRARHRQAARSRRKRGRHPVNLQLRGSSRLLGLRSYRPPKRRPRPGVFRPRRSWARLLLQRWGPVRRPGTLPRRLRREPWGLCPRRERSARCRPRAARHRLQTWVRAAVRPLTGDRDRHRPREGVRLHRTPPRHLADRRRRQCKVAASGASA